MPYFVAKYKEEKGKKKKTFLISEPDILSALNKACELRSHLNSSEDAALEIDQLFPVGAGETPDVLPMPSFPMPSKSRYYYPKHFYQVMIVEGTRLLNIKQNGKNTSYGSLLKNADTGEMCYACPDGQFFDHEQVLAKRQKYFSEDTFIWHPVYFPLMIEDGKIDLTYYITSRYLLTFPIQFWGHESYDQQIAWLIQQEGLE